MPKTPTNHYKRMRHTDTKVILDEAQLGGNGEHWEKRKRLKLDPVDK